MIYKRDRDSKREISFKASMFRFSLAFVVVLVAGLITNIYVHQIDFKSRLPEDLVESKNFQLSIDDVEIRFKKGLFPIVGLFSKRVEWKDRQCSSRRVVAQDVFLVLDFFSLIKGKLHPGRVDIAYAEVITPSHCAVTLEEGGGASQELPQSEIQHQASNPVDQNSHLKSSYPKEVFEWVAKLKEFQFFPKVNVNKFDFKYLKGYREELVVKGKFFLTKATGIHLSVELAELFMKGYELPLRKAILGVDATDDRVSVAMSSSVREGFLTFEGIVKNDKEFSAEVDFSLEKLPLSPFSAIFLNKTHVSYLWLDCGAQFSAPWDKIQSTDFSLKKCELSGPYGSAQVNSSKLNLKKVKELELELSKFQVDQILKSKREAYFSGVFSKYGDFSSLLTLKDGEWSVEGFLQDSELIFSRNNLRDIQKISKLPFKATGRNKNWQILFNKIELDKGVFDGEFKAQFTNGLQKAEGRLSIHKLLLRPEIYKLMILSEPTPLSFYGKIELNDKKVTDWSGLVAANKLQGEKYEFSALKIEGRKGSGQLQSAQFKFSSPAGKVSSDSEIIRWLQPTTLSSDWKDKDYNFKEFSLRLSIEKDRTINWQRGYLKFANGWQLSSEGNLTSNREKLDIWIQWDRPDRQYLRWEHKDKFLSGGWSPKTQWVRDWLEKNPGFVKENSNIRFVGIEPKKLTDDLGEMNKKTIEKVKGTLSIKSEDKKKGS